MTPFPTHCTRCHSLSLELASLQSITPTGDTDQSHACCCTHPMHMVSVIAIQTGC
eukprot:m.98929 g.98929  ORF g.98929 m.98929 type:complete len:55 (-) comp20596_c0_seq11:2195-2359(-)